MIQTTSHKNGEMSKMRGNSRQTHVYGINGKNRGKEKPAPPKLQGPEGKVNVGFPSRRRINQGGRKKEDSSKKKTKSEAAQAPGKEEKKGENATRTHSTWQTRAHRAGLAGGKKRTPNGGVLGTKGSQLLIFVG